jgi:hypothetical protein
MSEEEVPVVALVTRAPRKNPLLPAVIAFAVAAPYYSSMGMNTNTTTTRPEASRVVLPDPRIIGCVRSACPMWLDEARAQDASYPVKLTLDLRKGVVVGLSARYDRGTSEKELESALNERFRDRSKVVPKPPRYVWRSDADGVAVQLNAEPDDGKPDDAKDVIYLKIGAFGREP